MVRKKKTPVQTFVAKVSQTKPRNFIGLGMTRDIFHTTPEQFADKWRELRTQKLTLLKSAVWSDEEAWGDFIDWLKGCLLDPPEEPLRFGLELFSGGIQVGFVADWDRSQVAQSGDIVLLRAREPSELCFVFAPPDRYREGFRIDGLTNAYGVRLVIAAAQLPAA